MQLKNYQETAIDELLEKSKKLLQKSDMKKMVFRSPTGSGKTIMMAEFLQHLVDGQEAMSALSFIWTAPRKLHTQSKNKLEKYYENTRTLECSNFEDLTDKRIDENEILFLNWESINKKDKNTIVKENEKEFYLDKIIENTKEEGRTIVLIIDESHHHATSDISQKLINDIAPKLTIEVSATPVIQNADGMVVVEIEDVKIEGMIKKSVALNADFGNIFDGKNIETELAGGADALVLKESLKKRAELVKAYQKSRVDINPLLLIQLPDRKPKQDDVIRTRIENLLRDEHGITTKNGKLAICLSEQKENFENIAKHNHDTEVLIFKQSIALGWDCPRAHILVLFREWKSFKFSIQTLGRIMRMSDPDEGHYDEDVLNHGYVYTNLSEIEINEDMSGGYVTIHTSKRNAGYQQLNLLSVHSKRHREKTRLSPRFIEIFMEEAKTYQLKTKLKTSRQKVKSALISDFQSDNIDSLAGENLEGNIGFDVTNEEGLQRLFDYFVRSHLVPFHPEQRSIGRVKETVYRFLNEQLQIDYIKEFEKAVTIVLSKNNSQHFINVLEDTKIKYKAETEERAREVETDDDWELPESIAYGENHTKWDVNLSEMRPFYYDKKWKTEKAFIEYLERAARVKSWFKNGDRDATFFAVAYTENTQKKPFYVDFIIRTKDGRIGLFDTKSGITITDAKDKSDGLQAYIKQENRKGKKLFGGIVTNTQPTDFKGSWKYFTGKGKNLVKDKLDNWETLPI